MCVTESLCFILETNTTLIANQLYTSIKIKKTGTAFNEKKIKQLNTYTDSHFSAGVRSNRYKL